MNENNKAINLGDSHGIGGTHSAAFGQWLKQKRKDQGISVDRFAELLSCSVSTLLKIEAGERRPSHQLAELLAANLGIAGDEIESFVTFARLGHPASPAVGNEAEARAPWRTARRRLSNLPSPLTSFIGREEDIYKARNHILQQKVRLLTLTGAPGIGKTRLALQVGSELVSSFEDGVFLVELAPVSDPDLLISAIARTLGLAEEAMQPIEEVLLRHVSERRMLLVLDNFEHLLDAAPAVVKLLESSPLLKVLATSREALHVRGEHRMPLPPLKTPELVDLPSIERLATYSAITLFVDRAEVACPGFELTEANAEDVAAICAGLDGLPLALELAVARLTQFSPREVRAALSDRLRLLTGGERDLPLRQRTLRSAIAWSYDLLGTDEQRLLQLLGTFVGGFTPEAAAALLDSPRDIQEQLAALMDKNLIKREAHNGEVRYGLLEVIREFALETLEAQGEGDQARQWHALYFLGLAQKAASHFAGPDQVEWLDKVEQDYSNVSEALGWLLGEQADKGKLERLEMAAQLCIALFLFWGRHSHPSDARTWFRMAAERIASFVRANTGALVEEGAVDPTSHPARVAQALSPELPVLWASMLSGAGVAAYLQGDYQEARTLHEQGLALRRELADRPGIAASLNNLGNVASEQGDLEAACQYHAESLAIAREIEDEWKISMSLNNLGIAEMNLCNFEEARALLGESLTRARKTEDAESIARALDNMGILARYRNDFAEANIYFDEALSLEHQLGQNRGLALTTVNVGYTARDQGDYVRARSLFLEGLHLVREIGDKRVTAECLEGLASLVVATGSSSDTGAELAAKLYGAGSALRRDISAPLAPAEQISYDHYLHAAKALVGEATWAAAWAEGQSLTIEGAVALAQGA